MIKYSLGNRKVPKSTLIMNITSARDCIAMKLGICKIPDKKCYALKAERLYPAVLTFRREQEAIWDILTADQIAMEINMIVHLEGLRAVRFQESGDFRCQSDVDKMCEISNKIDVPCYTYTSRYDLNYDIPRKIVINGSGFMVDNEFTAIKEPPENSTVCPMSCKACDLCMHPQKLLIYCKYH